MSLRESKWELCLSALMHAILLFFAFDKHNYSRWTLCYYNNRLLLKEVFPNLYKEFMDGDFAIKFSQHEYSALPVD